MVFSRNLILLSVFVLSLPACGEPNAITETRQSGEPLSHQVPANLRFSVSSTEPEQKNLLLEVFLAEFEATSYQLISSDDSDLYLEVLEYHYLPKDSNGWLPGCLVPGLIPFGPLSIWWWYRDNQVATPALEVLVRARFNGESLDVVSRVIRGVSRESDLARVAFSEVAREVRQWLKEAS